MNEFAIVCDTETTDVDNPDVIQWAHSPLLANPQSDALGEVTQAWFKPTKPISLGAMSTHHIVEEDLQSHPVWPGKLELPEGVGYVGGHNVDFDWKAIGKPKVRCICTLALARSVWPGLDSHKLGALIYHLYPHKMAREFLKGAHDAAVDIDLCSRLLFSLVDAVGRPKTWEALWQISEKARVPTHMTFGKYGPKDGKLGMSIPEMRKCDPGYVSWLLKNADVVKDDQYWQKALTA